MPQLDETLRQTNGVDRLAFAAGRRCDGGDEDELATTFPEALQDLEAKLGAVTAVRFEQVFRQSKTFCNGSNRLNKHKLVILGEPIAREPRLSL
jgi:hypothetical protein